MMTLAAVVWGMLSVVETGRALPEGESVTLPRSLADEVGPVDPLKELDPISPREGFLLPSSALEPVPETAFSLGPAGGYLNARGADRGTWFAGAQARLHFLEFFAAEASITFHENSYEHGSVHVTQYPVQLSGMFYPIPDGQFRPYVVAGVGWYYSRITYTAALSGISNQTDHTFGGHGGAGLELKLGRRTSIDADIRYIFLNPSSAVVKSGDFDYWQVTFGLNLFF